MDFKVAEVHDSTLNRPGFSEIWRGGGGGFRPCVTSLFEGQ